MTDLRDQDYSCAPLLRSQKSELLESQALDADGVKTLQLIEWRMCSKMTSLCARRSRHYR